MRIFIGSPPVVYKYIWVVAEADFKHIQKIAFGRSLKHCRAGELLWNLELSFWIKCSYLLYLWSQITGSCYWQLGRVKQSILPVSCVISPVGYEWSELRNSTVILQVHHSTPATGLQSSRFASCQEPKAHFCGHPSLTTFCFTQYGSPSSKACMDTDALKAVAFPHRFHNIHWWKSHQLWQFCISTHQEGWRSSHCTGSHILAMEYSPFWANAGKIGSQVLQQNVRIMCMLACCLVHGSSTLKLSKKITVNRR